MAAFHFFRPFYRLVRTSTAVKNTTNEKLSIDSRGTYIYLIKYRPLGGAISNLSYFFEPLYETAKQKFFKAKICKKMTSQTKKFLPYCSTVSKLHPN